MFLNLSLHLVMVKWSVRLTGEGLHHHHFYYPELKAYLYLLMYIAKMAGVFFCRVAGRSVRQDKELQLVEGAASPLCPVLPF